MMSEAPEKIWAWHVRTQDGRWIGKHAVQDVRPNSPTATEYVRADRIEELEAKLDDKKAECRYLRGQLNMSEYDETRDAARKVREKYNNTLRSLEDDVTYIVVKDTVEHEDGSATYSFDLSDGARDDLANIGLEFVLYCAATRTDIQDAFKLILRSARVEPESPMSKPGDKDYEV